MKKKTKVDIFVVVNANFLKEIKLLNIVLVG